MCVDLREGTTVWAERSFAPYGTLMIADGKVVILDKYGEFDYANFEVAANEQHER